MSLDQCRLEDEGLARVRADDVLEVLDLGAQGASLGLEATGRPEVGAHSVLEAGGLADADDLTLGVAHEVDAGPRGERLKLLLQVVGKGGSDHAASVARPSAGQLREEVAKERIRKCLSRGTGDVALRERKLAPSPS